jgi:GntR family transcriptional repressor for pyruvate dehydrogenase complex
MGSQALSAYFDRMLATKPERLREVIEFRLVVEPEVAALAAARRSGDDLLRMKRLVEEQEASRGEGFAELDLRFHMALARATKNEVIWEVAAVLHDLLSESRSVPLMSKERFEISLKGHRRILEAVEKKDPELCREAMRTHLKDVGEQVGGDSLGKG